MREEGTKKEIERKKSKEEKEKRRISLVWLTHICNSTYLGSRGGMIPSVIGCLHYSKFCQPERPSETLKKRGYWGSS